MKHYISPSNLYELQVPNGWTYEESAEGLLLYDPENGVGAVQISAYCFPTGHKVDLKEELHQFVSRWTVDLSESEVRISKTNGTLTAKCSFLHEGRVWVIWIMVGGNKVLFVTYNCREDDLNAEIDQVHDIVNSIAFHGPKEQTGQ